MPNLHAICRKHGRSGDHVFTLFTGSIEVFAYSEIPRSPPPPQRYNPRIFDFKPHDPLNLQWLNPNQPYMALIPCQDPFRGLLFSRLRYEFRRLPIVRIDSPWGPEWRLDPVVEREWAALEFFCRQAVMGLFNLSHGQYTPQRFELWPFPERFRYSHIWKTDHAARLAAFYARNAFLPLMGALSLMLLIFRHLEATSKINYYWPRRLEEETDLDHRWIECLDQSILSDFTNFPRLGGVIRVDNMIFRDLLPLFRTVNMPLVLYWGKYRAKSDGVTFFTGPHYLIENGFVPGPGDIGNLFSLRGAENLKTIMNATNSHRAADALRAPQYPLPEYEDPVPSAPPPAAEDPVLPFPPVVYGSGQPAGISMKEFFEKRANRRHRALERETQANRQAREARERNAERQACPGKSGATVFIWQLIDGHRIRVPAGRRHQDYHWENYSRAQRRYDSVNNQWDLCSEFGPYDDEADPDDDLNFEQNTYDSYGGPSGEGPPQEEGGLPEDVELPAEDLHLQGPYSKNEIREGQNQFSSIDDLQRDMDDLYPADVPLVANPELVFEGYEDTAYYRFGFHEEHPVPAPAKVITWPLIRKVLGNGSWALPPQPSEELKTTLCIFLSYLNDAEGIRNVPPPVYDLLQRDADTNLIPRKFNVQRVGESNSHFALVPAIPNEPPLVVVVDRAATVVEVLRHLWDADDFTILARQLLRRCIPFHTCMRGPFRAKILPENPKEPPETLGRREKDYQPDEIDYRLYVQLRNSFLQSPRGRAALLAGGIIARIAQDVVPYEKVYDGPLEDVYTSGIYLSAGQTGYYDDVLSDEEISLICGTYDVKTGKSDALVS